MQEEVSNLKKAKTTYIQRHQEWERCRDAARIAEQGAELGATGDNKVIFYQNLRYCTKNLIKLYKGIDIQVKIIWLFF